MNAKELRAAAEEILRDHPGYNEEHLAGHIIATVREDDDEPVTRERLESDGWFRRSIRYRHWDTQISVIEHHPEFIAEFETGQELCRLKSMGHLRRLVAALWE